jgi:hypothetical protein
VKMQSTIAKADGERDTGRQTLKATYCQSRRGDRDTKATWSRNPRHHAKLEDRGAIPRQMEVGKVVKAQLL